MTSDNLNFPHHTAALQLKRRRWSIGFAIVIVLAIVLGHFLPSESANKDSRNPKAVSVVTAVARAQEVPVYISALGSITPTNSVTVRTQINGQLLRVLFQEGQMVKAGELLAEIDSRPYQAQLTQYEGQLARDMALLTNAQLDLKRYQQLWKEDSVAKQTLDTQASTVKQNEGIVKIDQGLIDSTKVNLMYTQITAPISGRIGLRLVDPGNVVHTTDTNGLFVINTLSPITALFTIPEDSVPQVMDQINAKKTLPVYAYDRSQTYLLATGTLLTIDNEIDPSTGTVKLKAQFPNTDNKLFPNQFVNIKLWVNTLHNAIVVPTVAIQRGNQGAYVYLLNNDQTVSVRPVVTGTTFGDNTVVTTGITAGQAVVTDGADKLTDGASVTLPGTAPAAKPETSGAHHHKHSA